MSKPSLIKAHEARKRKSALRAADDPAELNRAARIVRAGIERGYLTKADLDGPIVQPNRLITPVTPSQAS
jgi:hypothetical protein